MYEDINFNTTANTENIDSNNRLLDDLDFNDFNVPVTNKRKNNFRATIVIVLLAIIFYSWVPVSNHQVAIQNNNATIGLTYEQIEDVVEKIKDCNDNTTCVNNMPLEIFNPNPNALSLPSAQNKPFNIEIVHKYIYKLFPSDTPINLVSTKTGLTSVAIALLLNPGWIEKLDNTVVFNLFMSYIVKNNLTNVNRFGAIFTPFDNDKDLVNKWEKSFKSEHEHKFQVNICTPGTGDCNNEKKFSLADLNTYFATQGIFFIDFKNFDVANLPETIKDLLQKALFEKRTLNFPDIQPIKDLYGGIKEKGQEIKRIIDPFMTNLETNEGLSVLNMALQIHTDTLNPIQIFWGVTLNNGSKILLKDVENYLDIKTYHLISYKNDETSRKCNVHSAENIKDLTNLDLKLTKSAGKANNVIISDTGNINFSMIKFTDNSEKININQEIDFHLKDNNGDVTKVTKDTFEDKEIEKFGLGGYIEKKEYIEENGKKKELDWTNVSEFNKKNKINTHKFNSVTETPLKLPKVQRIEDLDDTFRLSR